MRWCEHGDLGSEETCVDIGNAMGADLSRFLRSGEPCCGSEGPRSPRNGFLMRLALVPIDFHSNPRAAIERSSESPRTTHGNCPSDEACCFFGARFVGALSRASREELLPPRHAHMPGDWDEHPPEPAIDAIVCESCCAESVDEIQSNGQVVCTLEAALWACHSGLFFHEVEVAAIHLGVRCGHGRRPIGARACCLSSSVDGVAHLTSPPVPRHEVSRARTGRRAIDDRHGASDSSGHETDVDERQNGKRGKRELPAGAIAPDRHGMVAEHEVEQNADEQPDGTD